MNSNTIDPKKVLSGHEKGGFIQKGGLFNLHDNEYVLQMNNPSEAMKLIALASKKLAGKSKQTRELPNVGGGTDNNEMLNALLQIVNNQQKQIDQTTQALQLLLGIKNKKTITKNDIGEAYDDYDTDAQRMRSIFDGTAGAM